MTQKIAKAATAKPEFYWKANPHQWGPGRTHVIHEDGLRTACGRQLADVPGRPIPAIEFDCRACAQAVVMRERRAQKEREWEERQRAWQAGEAERARAREAENRDWWNWFQNYLQSEAWRRKRNAALKRAQGWREACGQNQATQVHHLTYAHVGNEPLFDLRAICDECHQQLTEDDRRRRGEAQLKNWRNG